MVFFFSQFHVVSSLTGVDESPALSPTMLMCQVWVYGLHCPWPKMKDGPVASQSVRHVDGDSVTVSFFFFNKASYLISHIVERDFPHMPQCDEFIVHQQ